MSKILSKVRPYSEYSNIQTTAITQISAVIEWTTNRPATSRIEYGLTPAYRWIEEQRREWVINHQITLSNLNPDTEYHFRVISVCERGRTAISGNQIFRILAVEIVEPPVIIDPPVEEIVEPPLEEIIEPPIEEIPEGIIREEFQSQIQRLQVLIDFVLNIFDF